MPKILSSNVQELNQVKLQSSLLDQMMIVQQEAKAVIYVGGVKAVVRVGECYYLSITYLLGILSFLTLIKKNDIFRQSNWSLQVMLGAWKL